MSQCWWSCDMSVMAKSPGFRPPCDRRSELQHPAPDGFVGDVEPALGEQILEVSVAEREAQVEPDRMLDDGGNR
jgi:hypothetical protein